MVLTVEGSSSEKVKFGQAEATVEYIKRRVHENFTVYVSGASSPSQTQEVIKRIQRECHNVLKVVEG